MGANGLGSRAIIGQFFLELEQDLGMGYIPDVSMLFDSNQESETYKWLGMSPAMREWVGGRHAKGLKENGVTIINKPYEATIEVTLDEIRRDNTGQVMLRVAEQARRANAHWGSLLTALLIAGEAATCYDGEYFFDTDHSEGDSGTQDNDLTGAAATSTQPTAAEAEAAIMACVAAILGYKDDQGEPMNEMAKSFRIMVPAAYLTPFASVLFNEYIASGQSNLVKNLQGQMEGFSFSLSVNARLTSGAKFYVFRSDAKTKALIRQEEVPMQVEAQAEGSAIEFNEHKHHYGIYASRNVGYGYWQHACLYTFT